MLAPHVMSKTCFHHDSFPARGSVRGERLGYAAVNARTTATLPHPERPFIRILKSAYIANGSRHAARLTVVACELRPS